MKTFIKVWVSISFIALFLGIAVVILAFASGATWEDIPTYSVQESYTDIENIDFDISYGEVDIVEGETFSIDADNLPENDFESYVSDGTWYIRDNDDNDFNLFGFRASFGQMIRWDNDYIPKITITLPAGFVAQDFSLSVAAGDIEADSINAVNGDFSVDAGKIVIDGLNISGESQYEVDAGNMVLNDVVIHNVTIDCGVGSVEIDGIITGDNMINSDVGKVELNIDGDNRDYSYDISADIGSIEIDGDRYHNLNKKINNETGNNLTLDCGIGKITVDFN